MGAESVEQNKALVVRRLAVVVLLWAASGCQEAAEKRSEVPLEAPPVQDKTENAAGDIRSLRRFESARRRDTDFAEVAPSNGQFGADPYRLAPLVLSQERVGWVGLLRGDSELVVLDEQLTRLGALPTPASPTCLAVDAAGRIYVGSELAPRVAVFEWSSGQLLRRLVIELPGVVATRDLSVLGPGRLALVEEARGRLLEVRFSPPAADTSARPPDHPPKVFGAFKELGRSRGPFALRQTERWLFTNSILQHTIEARSRTSRGELSTSPVTLTHDGPLWAFDAAARGESTWLIAAGVENAPLDRTIGSFGNIDSFLYLYELGASGFVARGQLNLSALGVVTPKVVLLRPAEQEAPLRVVVAGYATSDLLELEIPLPQRVSDSETSPGATNLLANTRIVQRKVAWPGASAGVLGPEGRVVLANPLFDAWTSVGFGASAPSTFVAAADGNSEQNAEWRIGEALFFTTLMAPKNSSEGKLSRFTCETCHFEGYTDGRVHHTGRGQVRASTKPLLGLFNNRPHFSRALDKDLSRVAHAEFRVAGSNSGTDPWFSVSQADFPWLSALGASAPSYSPLGLRRALMTYLMRLSHRQNPMAEFRQEWTASERRGAELFRAQCEDCHRAQLAADAPNTRVSFEAWENLSLAPNAPLVWGLAEYRKTGVVPYVHEQGARVPSLRRLYKKWPYFTNGSALSLEELLGQSRFGENGFSHASGEGNAFSPAEISDLAAFISLL